MHCFYMIRGGGETLWWVFFFPPWGHSVGSLSAIECQRRRACKPGKGNGKMRRDHPHWCSPWGRCDGRDLIHCLHWCRVWCSAPVGILRHAGRATCPCSLIWCIAELKQRPGPSCSLYLCRKCNFKTCRGPVIEEL